MKEPIASIVIATYNRPEMIVRALASVLAQTRRDIEVVIIDDSPNDETEKVVKAISDQKIKYFRNVKRGNLPTARNQGVKFSDQNSKYIAFLDDDDELLPDFLEKAVGFLEENKDFSVVSTNAEYRTRAGKKIGDGRDSKNNEFWKETLSNGSVMRKSIFIDEGFWYDERKVMEDLDFAVRVLKDHKIKYLPDILRIYYPYPNPNEVSASSSLPLREIELFYEKHLKTYTDLGKKALGFFYLKLGREFMKAKEVERGRDLIWKSFSIYPTLKCFVYFLVALLFPGIFSNLNLRILKYRIFKGKL